MLICYLSSLTAYTCNLDNLQVIIVKSLSIVSIFDAYLQANITFCFQFKKIINVFQFCLYFTLMIDFLKRKLLLHICGVKKFFELGNLLF